MTTTTLSTKLTVFQCMDGSLLRPPTCSHRVWSTEEYKSRPSLLVSQKVCYLEKKIQINFPLHFVTSWTFCTFKFLYESMQIQRDTHTLSMHNFLLCAFLAVFNFSLFWFFCVHFLLFSLVYDFLQIFQIYCVTFIPDTRHFQLVTNIK